MPTRPLSDNIRVVGEVKDADLWHPQTLEEWSRWQQEKSFLSAWNAQADHERKLRETCMWMIFGLVMIQTLGSFVIISLLGVGVFHLDEILIRILYPSLLAQIFGLFFIVARYLFDKPLLLDAKNFLGAPRSSNKSTEV